MDVFPLRRDKLLTHFREDGLDAFLVTQPINVTYLTGFTGEASTLLVTPNKALLISDGRFLTQLEEECPGLPLHIRPPAQTLLEATCEVLGKMPDLQTVGFEAGHLTVAEFEALKSQTTKALKPGANRIEAFRAIKDAGELATIRQSISVAEGAFANFRKRLHPEASEKELADLLEMELRRRGARWSAFTPIVAVGARSALPHAPATNKKVADEALVLVDWGADFAGYKSDLTRVLFPRPDVPAKIREIYDVVLRAQQAAIAQLRPGAVAHDIDQAARSVIADAGFGEFFNHSVGHGFGLQIHETPLMKQNSKIVLQAGMVVTVEPGIYLPGQGGVRIEDDVLITPDGAQVLTSVARQFDEMFEGNSA